MFKRVHVYIRPRARPGMINQSILRILLIISVWSLYLILIAPKDTLFKHATAYNMEGGWGKFLISVYGLIFLFILTNFALILYVIDIQLLQEHVVSVSNIILLILVSIFIITYHLNLRRWVDLLMSNNSITNSFIRICDCFKIWDYAESIRRWVAK